MPEPEVGTGHFKREPARSLCEPDLLFIFVGSVIGSGIFVTCRLILRQVGGSVGYSLRGLVRDTRCTGWIRQVGHCCDLHWLDILWNGRGKHHPLGESRQSFSLPDALPSYHAPIFRRGCTGHRRQCHLCGDPEPT